jgi:hypothetical protein
MPYEHGQLYHFEDKPLLPPTFFASAGPPNPDTSIYGNSNAPTEFKLTDLGNGQFTLAAVFNLAGATINGVAGAPRSQAQRDLHWD